MHSPTDPVQRAIAELYEQISKLPSDDPRVPELRARILHLLRKSAAELPSSGELGPPPHED